MTPTGGAEESNGQAKKPAEEQDSESAPLLNHEDAEGGNENNGGNRPSISVKTREFCRKFGRWLLNNRMVVAIVTLLIGGFIGLCIYFGGMRKRTEDFWRGGSAHPL